MGYGSKREVYQVASYLQFIVFHMNFGKAVNCYYYFDDTICKYI